MECRKIALQAAGTAALLLLLSGCGRPGPASSGEAAGAGAASGGHGHAHTPKYGGVLVEVGSHEFNLEVLVDPVAGKLTLWTLDAHAEAYVRIAAKALEVAAKVNDGPEQSVELRAKANPATGEVEGSSAQFEATAEWLKGAKDVEGVVKSVTLGGKSYTGLKFDWPHGNAGDHKH